MGARLEKLPAAISAVLRSPALSLAAGALGGVFLSVKVYGQELNHLRTRQQAHCQRVNLEKQVMYEVTRGLNDWIKATHATSASVCAHTPGCQTVTVSREVRLPDFASEKCGDEE